MQFTKAEEYGLFGSVYLAKQPRGAVISLSEIADAQQVPDKFLAKIFQSLTKAGILRSHRGVRGGFSLSRLPRRISIAEILNAIQGELDPLKCLADGQPCPKRGDCPIRELVMEGRRHMFAYYNKQSLQELSDRYR